MCGEWHNYGDVNITEYGGNLIRDLGDGSYEYFKVVINEAEGKKYAFHGDISCLEDYYGKDAGEIAEVCGVTEEWYRENPEAFVSDLLDSYGCGVFEFAPRNYDNTPYIEYSTDYEDFRVTDEELELFLEEAGINFRDLEETQER